MSISLLWARLIVVACRDLDAVSSAIRVVVRQRRILRFLRAKQHSIQLAQLVQRLEWANQSFTVSVLSFEGDWTVLRNLYLQRTMLSSVDVKASDVLDVVLPLRHEVHRLTRIGRYFFLTQP